MKALAYLIFGISSLQGIGQSLPVKNADEIYSSSALSGTDIFKTRLLTIARDTRGITWFQTATDVFSFDGANWKAHKPRTSNGKYTVLLINDMLVKKDGNIFLATEDGIYMLDHISEDFVPLAEVFTEAKNFPRAVSGFFIDLQGKLFFISEHYDGFFLFDFSSRKLKHISIDSSSNSPIPPEENQVITDQKGKIWGLTKDRKGIWQYDLISDKLLCSWKNELPAFPASRYRNLTGITYSGNDNAIWLSYGSKGWLEKKKLNGGDVKFFSFSGSLNVQTDTLIRSRLPLSVVKSDPEGNAWVMADSKFLIKLDEDPRKMEWLDHRPGILSMGDFTWMKMNEGVNQKDDRSEILFWTGGYDKICMIRRQRSAVRHIPYDTSRNTGISPEDFDNSDERHNIFFVKGNNSEYLVLQQDAGRPKLIRLDKDLHIKDALLNNEWKQYPAYFNSDFNTDSISIAILRAGLEPLNFRTVVIRDFVIDLKHFTVREIQPGFPERVWRYGVKDLNNVSWLYSNGCLYSFDAVNKKLDSIYISAPAAKGFFRLEFIKGFDYPAVLHKATSTFWISFVSTKELYKVNLRSRKVEKIFKCCIGSDSCAVPGGIYDMYELDDRRIYLMLPHSAMLLYPEKDSLIPYNTVFNTSLITQNPTGSVICKDILSFLAPSRFYFKNLSTGKLKWMSIGEDYKWRPSQLNSPPLVNDKGEMVLMSSLRKGFVVFNPDSLQAAQRPGNVQLSYIRVDNKNLPLDSIRSANGLRLKFKKYNSIQFGFSDLTMSGQQNISYEYSLYQKGDTGWNKITGKPELTVSGVSPGNYKLLLRASNPFGDYSQTVSSLPFIITPPFWRSWWFSLIMVGILTVIVYAVYRYRLAQVIRLQNIRNNIARDLHDDIGSTLNSISIYSEVAKKQAGVHIPALDLIGSNSRAIIESMSDIVWTINPENDSFEKIITRMRSFAYQLLKAKKVEYTFEADEQLHAVVLPMQVRKNFYLVFKEAITNVLKYSEATKVAISLRLENKCIRLRIRDNGKGIPSNFESQGNGLLNMNRRAQEINAELIISSANKEGTEIDLSLKV